MKFLVIVALCTLVVIASAEFSPEKKEIFRQRAELCQSESGVSVDLLKKLRAGQPVDSTPELRVNIIYL